VRAHPDTVAQGVRELDYPDGIPGRIRRPGAGRPGAGAADPGLWDALDALVDPVTRGDPESALRWTTKSTTKLAGELVATGHPVSPSTVGKLLKANGYSLQSNTKTIEGKQHVDRDAQFGYLNQQATAFGVTGDPVISVDTKKSCDTRSHVASELAGQEGRLSVGGVVPGQCSMARARSDVRRR